jgi:hypothetical protein
MNIRKLLAITLLTITVIAQAYQMPSGRENNQSQRALSPWDNQDLEGLEDIIHQMHIGQEERHAVVISDNNSPVTANNSPVTANVSPVTANVSPVGVPPVSPILSMLENNARRETTTDRAPSQQENPRYVEAQSDTAIYILSRFHQNQVSAPRVPQNSPENDSNDVILPITFDQDDFII